MPGTFILTVTASAVTTTGVGFAEDLASGAIDRFRSLPIARSAVLAGRMLSAGRQAFPRGLGGPSRGDRLGSCTGRSFDIPFEHGQHPCLHNPDARDVEPIDDEAFKPLRA